MSQQIIACGPHLAHPLILDSSHAKSGFHIFKMTGEKSEEENLLT